MHKPAVQTGSGGEILHQGWVPLDQTRPAILVNGSHLLVWAKGAKLGEMDGMLSLMKNIKT